MKDSSTDRRDPGSAGSSFEERLNSAERRAGLGDRTGSSEGGKIARGGPDRLSSQDFSAMGLVFRLGTELVSALVVGVAIGYGLDRWLGHRPLFLVTFSLLGGVAGVLNVWRVVMRFDPK